MSLSIGSMFHRPAKTKDSHSGASTSSSQTKAQREAAGGSRWSRPWWSPSRQHHISSLRGQELSPPNQQLKQAFRQHPSGNRGPPSQQSQEESQDQFSGSPETSTSGRSAYPWSERHLAIQPRSTLIRPLGPLTQSPLPFPRCRYSLPPISTDSGELFLFGGLVNQQIRNDLYSFSTSDFSVALIETKGQIPPPRFGHASALVSNLLIVWGGDTERSPDERVDDALYLLNVGTREWKRVTTSGRAPQGRYGHAVTMRGNRVFVFGGQVDEEFFNDLWSFDLESLKTRPRWELHTPAPRSEVPRPRAGHICVTYSDKIYMFGGTDGRSRFSDTWCFDVPSRTWRELPCIGFIPAPRDGHAAALVDDVIYIFGGRGVDGKDLDDLAAFKVSHSRWYNFGDMGPSPNARSDHAMAASGSRVFVLKGGSLTDGDSEDPSIIHVLNSGHIKYPDSPSLVLPTLRPATPIQLRPASGPSPAGTCEKDNASGGYIRKPSLYTLARFSARSRTETASSTVWTDEERSFTATTPTSSMPDVGKLLESVEEATDQGHGAQAPEGLPQAPLQPHGTPDISSLQVCPTPSPTEAKGRNSEDAIPTETNSDISETILQSVLDDLTHLSVAPSRLTIKDSTEVGCGRYGEVLLATLDESSERPTPVAVKELRTVETRGVRKRIALRLARELRIWAKMNHPNLLPLIGYYLSENYEIARFISPLMTNGNVSQYLERAQVGIFKRLDIE
ncbi:Negative regulator of mitotic exit [Tulasnella sp. UAMH 9824]|nr:Negative regulator of mitotic exit [Tulasnella sp. UAMH 9824]